MNIAIIGSRSFNNYELLKLSLLKFISERNLKFSEIKIISGGAMGADYCGSKFAEQFNIEKQIFLPEWDKYGRSAGPIRNELIIKESNVVFAFWDGKSKGTKNALNWAKKYNKETIITTYEEENNKKY